MQAPGFAREVQNVVAIDVSVTATLTFTLAAGEASQTDSLQFTAPGSTGSTFTHRISGGVDFQENLYNGSPVLRR